MYSFRVPALDIMRLLSSFRLMICGGKNIGAKQWIDDEFASCPVYGTFDREHFFLFTSCTVCSFLLPNVNPLLTVNVRKGKRVLEI